MKKVWNKIDRGIFMNKSIRKDILIVSFALFSMFFGAGNVIFPPYLGLTSGSDFLLSALGFIITGAGLPILGIIAIAKSGTFDNFANRVFNKFPLILGTCIMIAIGPLLAIPKTAALTYEIGIKTLFPSSNSYIAIIIFFMVTLFFSLNSSNVIDKLGAILTPLLLISLIILIVNGIVNPLGVPKDLKIEGAFSMGFVNGYQTMDAFASIMFAMIIIKSISQKGYKDEKLRKITSVTGFFAGLGLALIYFGLLYIGSCASGSVSPDISKSDMVIYIADQTMGYKGKFILAMIISFACLTTAIGLTTTAGEYFETITNGKLKYKLTAVFTCIFSACMAYLGVDKIVAFSAPILSALYPTTIILIVFNVISVKNKYIYKGACLPVLIYGILTSILPKAISEQVNAVYPMFTDAFGWLPLAIVGGVIGYMVSLKKFSVAE